MSHKISFCTTCIHEKGSCEAMKEADARIHKDNNPTHNVTGADIEEETPEVKKANA